MLALAVMPVVFVLGESISLGASFFDVTAGKRLSSLWICLNSPESATVT